MGPLVALFLPPLCSTALLVACKAARSLAVRRASGVFRSRLMSSAVWVPLGGGYFKKGL